MTTGRLLLTQTAFWPSLSAELLYAIFDCWVPAQAAQRSESTAADEENASGEQKEGGRVTACKEEKDRGGLPGVECSVCLNRPVQVKKHKLISVHGQSFKSPS